MWGDPSLGSFSPLHWLIVLCVILIVFGAGKLPQVLGDVAKGIKSFKANLAEEEPEARDRLPTEDHTPG
jgi:sec-independent protein translocase protein TatA